MPTGSPIGASNKAVPGITLLGHSISQRTTLVVLVVLAFLPLASVLALFVHRWLAVDTCLDRGGAYDYAAFTCSFDVQPSGHGPLIPESALLLPILLALAAVGWAFRARRAARNV